MKNQKKIIKLLMNCYCSMNMSGISEYDYKKYCTD